MNRHTSTSRTGHRRQSRQRMGAAHTTALLAALLLTACGMNKSVDVAAVRQQIADGKAEAAMPSLKILLADQPNSAEGRYLMGLALLRQRDPKAAEIELRKARELGHPQEQVAPPLAESLLSLGKADRLVAEFSSVQLSDPVAQGALSALLAEAQLQLGRRDRAASAAQAALKASPGDVRAALLVARLAAMDGQVTAALAQVDAVNERTGRRNADAWQTRGDILLYGQRDLDGALKAYSEAIAVRPDQVLSHFARIQVLLYRGDAEGAKQAFQALQKAAPGLLQTRMVEAQLAYVGKDFGKAKTLVQGLLALVPDDVRLLTLAGAVSLRTGDLQLGETNLARAVQLMPNSPMSRKLLAQTRLLMGKQTAALSDLQPLLESTPPDSTAVTLAAEAYLAQGDFKRADELYQRAVAADPEDSGVRLSAALSRLARGDSHALADLEALATRDSGDTAALAVVSTRLRRGELDDALKQLDALLKRSPSVASYHDLKGSVLLRRGDRVGATAAFKQALTVDPGFFPSVKKLSMIDVAAKDEANAQARLEEFVKQFPKHAEARMALVDWTIYKKRPQPEVVKSLEDLIRIDPRFIPARLKLVESHLAAHANKAAVGAAQDAITANPDRPELLEALGRAQVAASELQQAQNTFQKLVVMAPRSPVPLMRLADVQVQQNNVSGAESTLRRAMELAPGDAEIRRRLIALAVANKQPDKALAQAREMQRARPKAALGYLFEAELAGQRRDWVEAAKALQAGLKAQAEPAATLGARLYVAFQQAGQAPAAEALIGQFGKAKPEQAADFFSRLGDVLMGQGDLVQAERMYREVTRHQPDNISALNNIAWLMAKQRKPGSSVPSARAVALSRGKAAILDTHAMALAADGQLAKGIEVAESALKIEPDNPGYRMTLARLLVEAKQTQRAREELERLKSASPSPEGAREINILLQQLGSR